MSDSTFSMTGTVIKCDRNATFNVSLDTGQIVRCTIAGKLRKNNIRILEGDTVDIEVSIYDISKGRIVYRK